MLTIKNTQRKIKVKIDTIRTTIERIIDLLGYKNFDIGIWFTTNNTIRNYNKTYRYIDKPTDVLSFPYHTEIKGGDIITVCSEEDENLGDIIFSLEYIMCDAVNYEQTFEQRLTVLLVHGICHLLGYDHISDEDYEIMHKKELFLLKELAQ